MTMKPKLLTVALLLLAGTAFASNAWQDPDVILERGDETLVYRASDRTPEAIFKLLEDVIENKSQPGDKVTLCKFCKSGRYDQLDLKNIAELRGIGADKSGIVMTSRHDADGEKPGGASITLPANTDIRIENIYLECTPASLTEDGALMGWPKPTKEDPQSSRTYLVNVVAVGHDWGVIYDWFQFGTRYIECRNCKLTGARNAISLVHSAAKYTLFLYDCELAVDGNLSRSLGASSSSHVDLGGVYCPILLRAGTGWAENCSFRVKGWRSLDGKPYSTNSKWGPTRMVTVATDQYSSTGTKRTVFTAKDSRVLESDPGIATVVYDLDFRYGQGSIDNEGLIAKAELDKAQALEQLVPLQKQIEQVRSAAEEFITAARGGTGPGGVVRVWKP